MEDNFTYSKNNIIIQLLGRITELFLEKIHPRNKEFLLQNNCEDELEQRTCNRNISISDLESFIDNDVQMNARLMKALIHTINCTNCKQRLIGLSLLNNNKLPNKEKSRIDKLNEIQLEIDAWLDELKFNRNHVVNKKKVNESTSSSNTK